MMQVESPQVSGDVLRIRCAGVIGIGTDSLDSFWPAFEAVNLWMEEHPDHPVNEIVVDFTDVEYRWGDAPVSCFIPLLRRGVSRFRFVAHRDTAHALDGLFKNCGLREFTVDRVKV